MRLMPARGKVLMRGRAHWLRCAFDACALIDDVVQLAPKAGGITSLDDDTPFTGGFAGLAFDQACRLFHALPDAGRIEFLLWGQYTQPRLVADTTWNFELSGAESESGEFGGDAALPKRPLALACDTQGYLYVADPDTPAIWIVDIAQHEIARERQFAVAPLDLAAAGDTIYALFAAPVAGSQSWQRLSACEAPEILPWPPGLAGAERLDVAPDGRAFVLVDAGTATAQLVCLQDTGVVVPLPYCTDFLCAAIDPDFGLELVCARRPGEDFLRLRLKGKQTAPLPALAAPNYDGRGIARAPDGRIAYWTVSGLRHAAPARTRYEEYGIVYGFALDSGQDGNNWGRVELSACIPPGTRVTLRLFTADDIDYTDPLPRTPPAGEALAPIAQPDLTPLLSDLAWTYRQPAAQAVFRDPSPVPLQPAPPGQYARFDAPVIAATGRYLWAVLELYGTRSKTPRVAALQVHYPGHDLLQQLPKTLWREAAAQSFLQRYLSPPAAMLDEWGEVAEARRLLFDPRTAPAEALPWLAEMLGLAMDRCWSERARRDMIAEISRLFRLRGTLWSLRRMVEILTGAEVVIIEKFRLRGGGFDALSADEQIALSRSVLGGGFRVGGAIGEAEGVTAPDSSSPNAFDTHAHRFAVLVRAQLDSEQLACVARLIETHKPAHTLFDLCTVDAGLRVGLGSQVGFGTAIGPSGGLDTITLGDAVLGKGYVLGRPELSDGRAPGACSGEGGS